MLVTGAVHLASHLVTWLTSSLWVLVVSRAAAGASVHTMWAAVYSVLQETSLPRHRAATSAFINLSNE